MNSQGFIKTSDVFFTAFGCSVDLVASFSMNYALLWTARGMQM